MDASEKKGWKKRPGGGRGALPWEVIPAVTTGFSFLPSGFYVLSRRCWKEGGMDAVSDIKKVSIFSKF